MAILKRISRFFFRILTRQSPLIASKLLYYKAFKKKLDLNNPTTFNEKLMWLKLFEDDSLKVRCTDKLLVRDYVAQSGYSTILIDLYQVYDNVDEVNFNELPFSFVMKCTHGSSFNIICSDKDKLDLKITITQLKKWMNMDYSQLAAEPHYSKIKPRIIVEKFLGNEGEGKVPIDYKIHCFHGDPKVIEVVMNRGTDEQKHIMLDNSWTILPYNQESITLDKVVDKPVKLQEMLLIAKKLSRSFTYVRVDLYYWQNEIYFGELTFTPGACISNVKLNKDADYNIGKLLDLTVVKQSY